MSRDYHRIVSYGFEVHGERFVLTRYDKDEAVVTVELWRPRGSDLPSVWGSLRESGGQWRWLEGEDAFTAFCGGPIAAGISEHLTTCGIPFATPASPSPAAVAVAKLMERSDDDHG